MNEQIVSKSDLQLYYERYLLKKTLLRVKEIVKDQTWTLRGEVKNVFSDRLEFFDYKNGASQGIKFSQIVHDEFWDGVK